MMKNTILTFWTIAICNIAFSQVTVINQENIIAPDVGQTGLIIELDDVTLVEYNAENEVLIKGNGNGVWIKAGTEQEASYFLARIIPNLAYCELKETLDAGFVGTRGGVLHFKYIEKYREGLLSYKIYNYQRNEMIPLVNQTGALALEKKVGPNYFSLDLAQAGNFVGTNEVDSYYILEVKDENGDKQLLRFKYITSLNNQ